MVKILTFLLSLFILSCNDNSKSSEKSTAVRGDLIKSPNTDSFPTKELFIDKGDEEGWGADIRMSIKTVTKTDSSINYFIQSVYENKNIGLQIIIPISLPKNENELAQIITIKSCGEISNNFVQTLLKLYKQKNDATLKFVSSKKVAFIGLNEFAKSQLGKEAANKPEAKEMKLFFELENPDDNAELYININEKEHWVEIKEKDEGYRTQIIKALTNR